jgi:membrane-associated protein
LLSPLFDVIAGLPPWLVLTLVFTLPALEASALVGLVVPGEIAVLVGGMSAHGGSLPLWAVIVAAVCGAAVGDQVGFATGRRYGPRLLDRVPHRLRRTGDLDRALDLVRRRGVFAVVLGRWAAALRALVPGIAGMSGLGRGRFTAANVTGGALWASTVAVLGHVAGHAYPILAHRLGVGGIVVLTVVVVAVVVAVARARPARRDRTEQP